MTSSLKLIAVIAICILLTGSADPSGELKPMPVSDLSGVPADVVFGRLYDNGLLPQDARMLIYAEGKPPAEAVNIIGALPEILKSNPPDFLIFSGTRDELNRVADTLEIARGEILLSPTLADLVNGKSTLRIPETRGDGASDGYPVLDTNTRGRMDLAEFRRMQSGRLSDVRISLDSAMGLNIYDCFSILSQVSGISIILDPYAFQEPVGGRRTPLQEPPSPTPDRSGSGFRDASEFNTLPITSGGVPAFQGRFVDAPFDFVFETIVYSNNLDYIAITDPSRPYDKPILYVTSRERMEHELRLAGVSTIDVNQPHYADVDQITQILITMDILPSVDTGYYVYRGGFLGGQGGGGGFGGGGGGSGRGGQGGRGGAGGGGGLYGASIPLPTAKSGLIILRGTGGDQAAFYNRLIGRESKVRSGRKFFLRVALNPNALDDALSPENMTSFLLIL